MKKIIISLLAVSAVLASCTKDDAVNKGSVRPGKDYIAVSANVAGAALAAGDTVGLFVNYFAGTSDTTEYIKNDTMVVSSTGVLEGANKYLYQEDANTQYDVFAYYPMNSKIRMDSTLVEVNIPTNQSAETFSWKAYDVVAGNVVTSAKRNIALSMKHVLSMVTVKTTVEGPAAAKAVATSQVYLVKRAKINLKAGVRDTTAVYGASTITTTADNEALVVPQRIAQGAKVALAKIAVGENSYELPVYASENINLESGKNLIINVKVNSTDLKRIESVNFAFGAWKSDSLKSAIPTTLTNLSARGTANCYVVTKPGRYMFDATVMGNGATTEGIQPKVLKPASARLDWEILAAQGYNGSKSSYGNETQLTTMNLCIMKESVKYEDGFVYFDTPAALSPGNCVIDVLDAANNIIWSWHIWVSPSVNTDQMAVEIYNNNVKGVTIMDRNLGAYSNGNKGANQNDAYAARGMVYQWGRKDPFATTNHTGNACYMSWWDYENNALSYWPGNPPMVYPEDESIYTDGAWKIQDGIDYTIAHPHTYIGGNPYTTNGGMWVSGATPVPSWNTVKAADGVTDSITTSNWAHLWGNTTHGKDASIKIGAGVKTIYDPCPNGWRVPESGVFKFWMSDDTPGDPTLTKGNAWKYNVTNIVSSTATGISVNLGPTWGMNVYAHGSRSKNSEGKVVEPTDKTTVYFPLLMGRAWEAGLYPDANEIELHTNSACQNTANLYQTVRAFMTINGQSTFTDGGSPVCQFPLQVAAMPVRCIKEK